MLLGDELAKTRAIQDGAEVAQRNADGALDTRKKVHIAVQHAATFCDGVEELVDFEEISWEDNNRPRGFLGSGKLRVATKEWSELLKVRRSSCVYGVA